MIYKIKMKLKAWWQKIAMYFSIKEDLGYTPVKLKKYRHDNGKVYVVRRPSIFERTATKTHGNRTYAQRLSARKHRYRQRRLVLSRRWYNREGKYSTYPA